MNDLITQENDLIPIVARAVESVRDDMRDNPYILEALRVLPVQGYRSAIGAFWNAVVDDLRSKILYRSVALFNKEISVGREIKSYEDFQNYVNDDQLIEGAYKIGVIGWEAHKVLKHSKETRHIFSGHPKSSDPSLVKVLSVIDDCVKYVLNAEYPAKLIDISEYIKTMESPSYDRNVVSAENALADLPETYKKQLANQLMTIYVHPDSPSALVSNIEFLSPLLWKILAKEDKITVVRRVDTYISQGNEDTTKKAFQYIKNVEGNPYLSHNSKKYVIAPLVRELKDNSGSFDIENRCVKALSQYASIIPEDYIDDYVWAITHTYVGHIGSSYQYSRTNFYANIAATYIPEMFQNFNDRMSEAFLKTISQSSDLKRRIQTASKLQRLRALANIVHERASQNIESRNLLNALATEGNEETFFELLGD